LWEITDKNYFNKNKRSCVLGNIVGAVLLEDFGM
jgi:hypothetical protein